MTGTDGTDGFGGATPINVRVMCFSHVRHVLQRNSVELSMSAGSTTDDVLAEIRRMADGQLDALPMRVARNHSYVQGSETLDDGDELALIPPVQGG